MVKGFQKGNKLGKLNLGKKRTDEEKREISRRQKGKHNSPATEFKSGNEHPRWKQNGSSHQSCSAGYHNTKINNKWVRRTYYNYITKNTLGYNFIPNGWIIHHINKNKTDDRIENLVMIPNDLHTKYHQGGY